MQVVLIGTTGKRIPIQDLMSPVVEELLQSGEVPSTRICPSCSSMSREDTCPGCGADISVVHILTPSPEALELVMERCMDLRKLPGDTDGDIYTIHLN